jgi:hypothetical protein
MKRNVYERNRRELWIFGAVLVFFAFVLNVNRATTFLAMADGPCIEQPSLTLPAWVDPNKIAGHLIDVQTVPAGKFNRVGSLCDPAGYPIDVELLAGPPGFTATADPNGQAWTIAGELPPGDWGIVARGRNHPRYGEPNEVIVTVYVRALAPANDRPRLY